MSTSAKYHTLIKPLLLGSLVILSAQSITNNALAESKYDKERWFEVEVILFSQLGDKSKLKEQFPDDTPSVTAKLYDQKFNRIRRTERVVELLQPFLKPNTSALKLQLPICGEASSKEGHEQTYIEQAATPLPFYQEKSLADINNMSFDQVSINTPDKFIDDEIINNKGSDQTDNKILYSDGTFNKATPVNNNTNENLSENTDESINDSLAEKGFEQYFEPLTAETIALVNEAADVFSPFQFNLAQDHLPHKTSNMSGYASKNSKSQLCRLSDEIVSKLEKQDPNFDKNDFIVDKIPKTIDAAEDVYNSHPYLLSESSLKLNDIVKQLRWSKTFKPLLHVGWRLAPKGRNKAIPLHIFAGDNLIADYQKQLVQYNTLISAAKDLQLAQQQLNTENNQNDNVQAPPLGESEQYQQALNTRLTNILSQLTHFNKTSEDIIEELNNAKIKPENLNLKKLSENEQLEQSLGIKKPKYPLQPWFLEGLFKVHLNHYLFITADFTLINKTLAEQASEAIKFTTSTIKTDDQSSVKLIEFKQNRRVISQEIHYFDNPYLGMIVQIRRHKRPEPPVEEELEIQTDDLGLQ